MTWWPYFWTAVIASRAVHSLDVAPWPMTAAWIAVTVLLWWRPKIANALVVPLAVWLWAVDPSNFTILVGWVAAASALFNGDQWRTAIRTQTAVVYLFAGLNKLWPAFLSGWYLRDLPAPQVLSWLALGTELLLAWMVWRREPLALPAAVVLHAGIVLTMASNLHGIPMFNALVVGMVVVAVRHPARQNVNPYLSAR